jgi:hypothetical protein
LEHFAIENQEPMREIPEFCPDRIDVEPALGIDAHGLGLARDENQ